MIEKFQETFREEALELLNSLESSLLELEEDPNNTDEILSVFRTMHTIKGSAAMFGFEHISAFAHELENALELVKAGEREMTRELSDITLRARDHIRGLLEEGPDPSAESRETSETIMAACREAVAEEPKEGQSRSEAPPPENLEAIGAEEAGVADRTEAGSGTGELAASPEAVEGSVPVTYRIRFSPPPEVLINGTKPLLLLSELREMGEFSCIPHFDRMTRLSELDPEQLNIYWDVILTTSRSENEIRDVFIFIDDSDSVHIEAIDQLDSMEDEPYKRIGQILVERGVVDSQALQRVLQSQKRLGELLVDSGVDRQEVATALEEQQHVQKTRQRAQSELSTASVRVSSEKLDKLVDLVGELVTLQARLTQTAGEIGATELSSIVENFDRMISELRDNTMSVRMLPIGTTFSKFRRLVRDLSQELGKQVDLVAEGGETELDKTVIERLSDPLVHIIRNCLDHGLETPDERRRSGKPAVGHILLAARHVGANVQIRVTDDGKGLDRERIRERAVERGIISAGAELSDSQIDDLIFAPGFSTAAKVTTVSGRGVGMDVVRNQMDALGGSVGVSSAPGEGTEISLNIPLTLAIIEGLLVEVGSFHYVFPLGSVDECIEFDTADTEQRQSGNYINNRGEILPYISMRELFRIEGESPKMEQIVVVESQGSKIGVRVDRVIGDYQTVIKSLGRMYRNIEGVSGATILGDGSVALIVDVARLASVVGSDRRTLSGAS
jgi:two-component system chemotaxis sensor kinase CheA